MKRKLIAGLITFCAVFMAACSNKTSKDSADSTAPPVTESTNKAPSTQAAPSGSTDNTQAQTTPSDNTGNTQTSPSDSTDNTQTPGVSVQSTPAPKNAADSTSSQKTATDEESATDKNSTTDTTSKNSSAKTAASQGNAKSNKLLIGKKKAKAIALKDAGLKKKNVHFTEVKLDYDDGRSVYDIEFYSRKKEYDYEIDAATGKILSSDWDSKTPSTNNTATGSTTNKISMTEAKKIALKSIGLTENDGRWKKAKSDKDDGRFLYELEFISGKTEHEFEIDANSGEILEYDKEPIR